MTAIDRLETQLVATLRRNLATRRPVAAPEAGRLLWQIFGDLSGTRTYNATGPNPISYQEIVGYAHICRWPLQPHHVAILRAMEDAWLEHVYRNVRTGDEGQSVRARDAQTVNPAAFDAVFG